MMVSSVDTTIFISAGEASGEHYGALLISALQKQLAAEGQRAQFFGMGGERMRAAGLECVVRAEEMAVMGFTEVVRHLPRIYGEFRRLKKAIRARRPAVAVLIDFPGFHFKLAEALHREGVPVLYFVSPQLWAWKKKRIRLVQKYIDKMLVIFPFEEAFYREHGVEAEFVGHPLAELPLPAISRVEFAAASDLDPAKMWIGLLPGSRPKEIRELLPTMLRAAKDLDSLNAASMLVAQATENSIQYEEVSGHDICRAAEGPNEIGALAAEGRFGAESEFPQGLKPDPSFCASSARLKSCPLKTDRSSNGGNAGPSTPPDAKNASGSVQDDRYFSDRPLDDRLTIEFILPLAPTLNATQRAEVRRIAEEHGSGLTLRLVEDARAALMHARASIVASGTATVEAALAGNPFVVVYRVSALTFAIAKRVVKVPHVAMANLIAGKRVAPELIQSDFTAENIVQQLAPLIAEGSARESMMEELQRVRGLLVQQSTGGAIDRVAQITLEMMRQEPGHRP